MVGCGRDVARDVDARDVDARDVDDRDVDDRDVDDCAFIVLTASLAGCEKVYRLGRLQGSSTSPLPNLRFLRDITQVQIPA